ncbi:MAG: PHP domain-containing protein [Candidatus Kapaibacterium sp.]|nr:MAG: PHP domain-containing protein [Candidatus Kapabacteria bacterium]
MHSWNFFHFVGYGQKTYFVSTISYSFKKQLPMPQFIHLHNHTHYSLLDGAATPETLLKAASEQGHDGYIRTRAERSSRAAFEEALASVSVAEAEEWDKRG